MNFPFRDARVLNDDKLKQTVRTLYHNQRTLFPGRDAYDLCNGIASDFSLPVTWICELNREFIIAEHNILMNSILTALPEVPAEMSPPVSQRKRRARSTEPRVPKVTVKRRRKNAGNDGDHPQEANAAAV